MAITTTTRTPLSNRRNLDDTAKMQNLMAGIVVHYGKVVRAITKSSVSVHYKYDDYSGSDRFLAYTNYKEVVLSFKAVYDLLDKYISSGLPVDQAVGLVDAMLKHETAHLLYSPRPCSYLQTVLMRDGLSTISNILEDNRIEVRFSNRYAPAKKYFTAMVMNLIAPHLDGSYTGVDDLDHLGIWALVAGRIYLPKEIRRNAKTCAEQHVIHTTQGLLGDDVADAASTAVDQIEKIQQEYLSLVPSQDKLKFSGDDERMYDLCREMRSLFGDVGASCPDSATEHDSVFSDHVDASEDNDELTEKVKEDVEDNGDCEGADSTPGGKDGDSTEGNEPEQGEGISGEEGTGSIPSADPTDSDGYSDAEASSSDDYQKSTGGADAKALEAQVKNLAKQTIQDVADLAAEELRVISSVGASSGFSERLGRKPSSSSKCKAEDVVNARQASIRMKRELNRLRSAIEEEWVDYENRGRLNLREVHRRMVRGKPMIEVHRRWDDGNEEDAGIDMAVIVDGSGSMSVSEVSTCSAGAWAFKEAMDKLGQPCAIIGYDDQSRCVVDVNEKSPSEPPFIYMGGSTCPENALVATEAFFARPDAGRVQVAVILTDGMFDNPYLAKGVIHNLNEKGVITVLFGVSDAVKLHGDYGCQFSNDIESGLDMVPIVSKIVQAAQRGVLDV